MSLPRTIALTALAVSGFAANSLLCRLALAPKAIDPATFTSVRFFSGAVVLAALVRAGVPREERRGGTWGGALALAAYAVAFSLAYTRLGSSTGSLLQFSAVQLSMIGWGIVSGERPRPTEWLGLALAVGGLVALTLPGLTAPDPTGAALSLTAGSAWGVYSILGRRETGHPLAATAGNFLRCLPFVAAFGLLTLPAQHGSGRGVLLAVASGTLSSGVGYSFWYAALKGLTATRASIVQLAVPVLAVTGGVLLLDEAITPRLVGAGAAILVGIGLALLAKSRPGTTGSPDRPPGPGRT